MLIPGTGFHPTWQRCVAVLGAYVLALEMALSGFVVVSKVAWAIESPSMTCVHYETKAHRPPNPADTSTECPCCTAGCVMACSVATGGNTTYSTTWYPTLITRISLNPQTLIGSTDRLAIGPHKPRAPPA